LSLKLLQQRGCRQELLEGLVVEGKTLSHNETLSDASVLDSESKYCFVPLRHTPEAGI
jgi:hypothetical protein